MIDVVCAIVRNSAGLYLACQRPAGKHLGGLWEFPGGKVEAGEIFEDALIRELVEELELQIEILKDMRPVIWSYETARIRLFPFLCLPKSEPRAIEHQRICWCHPLDFFTLEWAPADLPILDEILKF